MDPPFVCQSCHLGLVNECQDHSYFSTLTGLPRSYQCQRRRFDCEKFNEDLSFHLLGSSCSAFGDGEGFISRIIFGLCLKIHVKKRSAQADNL